MTGNARQGEQTEAIPQLSRFTPSIVQCLTEAATSSNQTAIVTVQTIII